MYASYRVEYGLSVRTFDTFASANVFLRSLRCSAWLYRTGEREPIGQTVLRDGRWSAEVWGERVKTILLVSA